MQVYAYVSLYLTVKKFAETETVAYMCLFCIKKVEQTGFFSLGIPV